MDRLTFLAQVIESLAWPVTVLIILLILHRPLSQLLPLVQRLRFWEFEMDFGTQVQELASRLSQEIPAAPGIAGAHPGLREHWVELARLSPRAVVLEAWLQLEQAAIAAARRHGIQLTTREMRSPIILGHSLEQAGIIDETKQEIYTRLRNLRNAAAHASEFAFEPESALEYADLALRLAKFFDES